MKMELRKAYLFSDGCGGQNKNSIIATTLLYIINNSTNLEEVSLRFFAPHHGQNEGDSAHSAISNAVKKAGDIMVPSQLIPVFRLARRQNPYTVFHLSYTDFLDFKTFSQKLRILSIRTDDSNSKEEINWNEMCEFSVKKSEPTKIYFKNSLLQNQYRSISLKGQISSAMKESIPKLYKTPPPISKEKYKNLLELCDGPTAVVKLKEHADFFCSLPH